LLRALRIALGGWLLLHLVQFRRATNAKSHSV
jgi:hypothetical protein